MGVFRRRSSRVARIRAVSSGFYREIVSSRTSYGRVRSVGQRQTRENGEEV